MNQSDNDLVHQAESILAGLGSRQRQLSRLFELEDELKARGVPEEKLFDRIDDLREQSRVANFRCRYRVFT